MPKTAPSSTTPVAAAVSTASFSRRGKSCCHPGFVYRSSKRVNSIVFLRRAFHWTGRRNDRPQQANHPGSDQHPASRVMTVSECKGRERWCQAEVKGRAQHPERGHYCPQSNPVGRSEIFDADIQPLIRPATQACSCLHMAWSRLTSSRSGRCTEQINGPTKLCRIRGVGDL